jgi:hypothetical protein
MIARELFRSYQNPLWLLAQYERSGAYLRGAAEALVFLMIPAFPSRLSTQAYMSPTHAKGS